MWQRVLVFHILCRLSIGTFQYYVSIQSTSILCSSTCQLTCVMVSARALSDLFVSISLVYYMLFMMILWYFWCWQGHLIISLVALD